MSEPLALLYYSNLMPGGQLVNRLQDLGYRVQTLADMAALAETCQREKPLVVVAEILPGGPACASVAQLGRSRHAAYSGAGLVGGAGPGATTPGQGSRHFVAWPATPPLPNICRDCWTRFCKWNKP